MAALAVTLALGVAFAGVAPAWAHHGRDFLLAETAEIPHPGQGWAIARQDYLDQADGELELEPSVLFGISRWLAFEIHGHVARPDGGSFEYESTAPALHLHIDLPRASWGLGLSTEYEISSQDDLPDTAAAILSLSGLAGRTQLAFNLTAEEAQESGADTEWGYAVGLRRPLTSRLHWGIEARGSLDGANAEDNGPAQEDLHTEAITALPSPHSAGGSGHGAEATGHEALLGLYFEASERLSVNGGVGTGIDGGPDLSVRTAVVWRFQ